MYMSMFTHICVVPYGTPKEEVFSCYEDINSGGEDLKAQQLRRAVYYGEYIEMLDRLSEDPNFQVIRDPKSYNKGTYKLCPKESDRELILRAFAWTRNYRNYKRPLKSFLNEELQHYENLNVTDSMRNMREMEKLEEQFTTIMKIWRNVFSESDGAFRKWEKSKRGKYAWSPSIVSALWDVMYLAFADLLIEYPTEPVYAQCKDELQLTIQGLFESKELDVSGTVTVPKFMERKDTIHKALQKVLKKAADKQRQQPRRSRNFKNIETLRRDLYIAQIGRCPICGQTIDPKRIQDGDYVHIDHIKPWSKGGSSTKGNAALTHATCNMSKGAKEVETIEENDGSPTDGPS
jgi:5-methylcytosine-specific restriction endonuclease McrA